MKSWWPEKLRQRKSKLLAFILDFYQYCFAKTKNPLEIYKTLLEALGEPVVTAGVYFEDEIRKPPKQLDKKTAFLENLPEPKLIIPYTPSEVIFLPDQPSQRLKCEITLFFQNENEFLKHIETKLDEYRKKIAPIVTICREIALMVANDEGPEINVCIDGLSYCLRGSFTKDFKVKGNDLFIPFLSHFPQKDQIVTIKRFDGEKSIKKKSIEIPSDSLSLVKNFLFLLEGLNPLRFRLCNVCQKVFYAINPRSIYCSNACKQKAYRMRKKLQQEEG